MSKCAAIIEIGWIKKCFEADDPCGIIQKVEDVQDFECLLRMGSIEENKEGQKELDKLEAFLDKYHEGTLTMEDIQRLDIRLSIANITCHGIARTTEEVVVLKAKESL